MSISAVKKKTQEIGSYFDSLERKTFLSTDLRKIFARMRDSWALPKRTSYNNFLSVLLGIGLIDTVFNAVSGYKTVYSWKTDNELTVMSGVRPNSYYTHLSSMFLNGLTQQIPKTYYLNYEHYTVSPQGELSQLAIDHAFSKDQRKSNEIYSNLGRKVVVVNGKKTNRLGVIEALKEGVKYSYTDLERTLIDIAIRPAYSGGVFEVFNAYVEALGKVDPSKISEYLNKMDYLYPYHQVIGFYMDISGYDTDILKMFSRNIQFDFYLTYNIRSKDYSEKWRLFYPKGLTSLF
jgi:predicted transcriptional regulator of viral defense system